VESYEISHRMPRRSLPHPQRRQPTDLLPLSPAYIRGSTTVPAIRTRHKPGALTYMKDTRQIHVTRARCELCSLDKMIIFYRIPNATPSEMHKAHRKELRKRFKEKYHCPHKVHFSREVDKDHVWDIKQQKAIKREGFIS
jgi:hypothetical protein